jgi:sialidase-1
LEKFTVSRDDAIYEAWPDVVLTRGGRLLCVFTECAHHVKRNNVRLVLCASGDRGRAWSEKRPLTSVCEGAYTWNCARISRLRDDSLVVLCDLIEFGNGASGKIYMWRGDPEGERFEGPFETPMRGMVPDKLTELPDGRLLLAAHRRLTPDGKLRVYNRYSDDGGKTWSDEILLAADERYSLCEPSVLPLSDGTLVAFLRENSFIGLPGYKAISRDRGETWEGVYETPMPCCHRPVATRLIGGKVLITFRLAHFGGDAWGEGQNNLFAALTTEAGCRAVKRNEQHVRLMPLDYDRSPNADLGYTGAAQFPDGEIYVVTYIMDDSPNSQIRGYSLREEDFITRFY